MFLKDNGLMGNVELKWALKFMAQVSEPSWDGKKLQALLNQVKSEFYNLEAKTVSQCQNVKQSSPSANQ